MKIINASLFAAITSISAAAAYECPSVEDMKKNLAENPLAKSDWEGVLTPIPTYKDTNFNVIYIVEERMSKDLPDAFLKVSFVYYEARNKDVQPDKMLVTCHYDFGGKKVDLGKLLHGVIIKSRYSIRTKYKWDINVKTIRNYDQVDMRSEKLYRVYDYECVPDNTSKCSF